MHSLISNRALNLFGCSALAMLLALCASGQGIPEPDLLMYGSVVNVTSNANLRLGYGTLTWVFQPAGGGSPVTASTTLSNINNQFSYIVRIPCETPVFGYPTSSNTIQLTAAGITFNRAYVTWNNTNLLSFVQPTLTNTAFFATDRGRIERVDLNVSSPIVIDPYNGLPVDWELTYFGKTGIDPLADPDHDGLSNFAEYRAGTDPTDPLSGLRFSQILPATNGMLVQWLSADFKSYALQRAPGPSGPFQDIKTGIPATAPTNTYVDTTIAGAARYFYRLRLDDAFSVATVAPLRFTGIRPDPLGGIRVDWLSTANQLYALERSSDLRAGFTDIATGIVATPPTNSFRDLTATAAGPYFYRLRLDTGSTAGAVPFKFLSIQPDPLGGLRLNWVSATNHLYTLQRSSNLSTGFVSITTSLAATPPANSYRDAATTGPGPYFYRLRLDQ